MTGLDALRAPVAGQLEHVARIFDAELAGDLEFVRGLCADAGRYRGKMLRPTLLLLSAEACGGARPDHPVLAAVVEMVHVATLVHDDVLDEADLRRHRPTINRMSGNEAAVLLGDYLISHAYHLCSSLQSTYASRRIAAATNRVCEGELMQVHHRGDWKLSEETYLEIVRRKTAELTKVCCELGAKFAGADAATVERMARFGEDLGIAFQIMDDLLDLIGTELQTGKTLGRDADLGKATLPIIHCLSGATQDEQSKLVAILSAPADCRDSELRDLLSARGSLDYARDAARHYARSAAQHLADLPPTDARESLLAGVRFTIVRRF